MRAVKQLTMCTAVRHRDMCVESMKPGRSLRLPPALRAFGIGGDRLLWVVSCVFRICRHNYYHDYIVTHTYYLRTDAHTYMHACTVRTYMGLLFSTSLLLTLPRLSLAYPGNVVLSLWPCPCRLEASSSNARTCICGSEMLR